MTKMSVKPQMPHTSAMCMYMRNALDKGFRLVDAYKFRCDRYSPVRCGKCS